MTRNHANALADPADPPTSHAGAQRPAAAGLVARLVEMARLDPDRPAVICAQRGRDADDPRYVTLSFGQLDAESLRLARGLAAIGVGRGVRTILMVPPGPEFFSLVFALLRAGAVPAVIDPGMNRRSLLRCLASVEAQAFVGVPLAHALRCLHPRAFASVRHVVTVGRRWFWGGCTLDQLRRAGAAADSPDLVDTPPQPDDLAAILFTTGSTGPAKGVVYRHSTFAAQLRALHDDFGVGPGDVDVATFPLFALFDPALGATAVVPDMDSTRPAQADPRKLMRAITDHKANSLFVSPALLTRLGEFGRRSGVSLPSLRRVISAGAPVSAAALEAFGAMLPDAAQVFTPYGATEALPVSRIGHREILEQTRHLTLAGAGVCVGRPVAGVAARIIPISDDPIPQWSDQLCLPPGEIGEIAVSGDVVTDEYWRNPAATRAAKIPDPQRGIWHRMGDLGYLDSSGRLWFCGRKAHRVSSADGLLFTIPCEAVFNQHPQVARSALVGVGPAGRQHPVLCVELRADLRRTDRAVLKTELLALGARHRHTAAIQTILFHPRFPVDVRHNAKIFREQLAVWAARRLGRR